MVIVSIYCLAYNHEKYIRDTLEGFIIQNTNFEYEVWVHDDASTDNTPNIIKEYADKYPNIIKPILQKENQYSKGIDIVNTYIAPKIQGKYVAVCEGDDYWCNSDKLQMQVDFLESHPQYSACVHNTKRVNCITGRESLVNEISNNTTLTTEDIMENKGRHFHLSSLMYRKEYLVLPTAFIFKGVLDYPLGIYLSMVGKIYYFKDVMSVYRLYVNNSWTSRLILSENCMEEFYKHYRDVNRMLSKIDQYSEGKYHSLIYSIQRKNNFIVLDIQGKYKRAYLEYKDVIDQFNKKERFKYMIKVFVPFSGKLYRFTRGKYYNWLKKNRKE